METTRRSIVKWSFGDIIRKIHNKEVPSDVYFINNELCLFFHIDGNDLRFSFDVGTGTTGKLSQLR